MPKPSNEDARALATAYDAAATQLALHVSNVDRITTDPDYPADRSPRAWDLREAGRVKYIAEFRRAQIAYLGA